MSFDEDTEDFEFDNEQTKAQRSKRLAAKKRKQEDFNEQRLRPERRRRPRVKVHYDPDYDEDDYEDMFDH